GNEVKRQQGDCLYCHAAHRGANAYDSLLTTFTVPVASTLASDQADGSYAALCFGCHGGSKPSGFAAEPVDIKRFATASSGYGGHSIVTSGGTLPVGAPLPCFECHNPHGSKRGNASLISDERGGSLETSTAAGVREFCFTCHTTNDTSAGWDSTSGYVVVSAASTVVGLPRDGGVLRLPPNYGHNEIDSESCYDCHGDSYAADGRNVHNPLPDGQQLTLAWVGTSGATETSDTVPPVTTADLAAAYSGTVSLDATDTGSGVAETLYSLDGGVLSTGTVVTAAGDGTHTVQFWSVDNASNVESPTIVAFLVDRTAPVTVSDAVASYVDSATIELSSQDNTGGAGVADTYYRLDGGDVATGTVVATSTVGPHTLDFWAVDRAGNAETTQTVNFTITASQAMSGGSPPAPVAFGVEVSGGWDVMRAADVVCREGSSWPQTLADTGGPPGMFG
ncbi:MAG TPA: cytochrome c3 family protein, partial [Coriobacteriia bacterium]